MLDVRSAADFGSGHVPNAINIGLSGKFATWAGTFITVGTPLAIAATTKEQVDEAFMRLARVGLESVVGFVLMSNFDGETRSIKQISANDASDGLSSGSSVQFVDVRQPGEYGAGHAKGAINVPLNSLPANIDKLDPEMPTYVICQTGYRSSLATSMLENAGFRLVNNVAGGTTGWIEAGLVTEKESLTCAA